MQFSVRQLYLRLIYSGKVLDTFTAKSTIKCNYTRWAHRRPVAIVNEDELFNDQNETDKQISKEAKTRRVVAKTINKPQQKVFPNEKNRLDITINKGNDNANIDHLSNRIVQLKESDNIITSLMVKVKSRKMREKSNEILLEGYRLIKDAIEAGVKPQVIFFNRPFDLKGLPLHEEVKLYKVPYKVLQLWSNLTTSPGIVGIFTIPDTESKEPSPNCLPLTIICDNVRDPENLGSVLRVAAGVGCEKLVLLKGCVDLWDPKVLKCAAGAHFRLPIYMSVREELPSLVCDGMDVLVSDNSRANHMNNVFDSFNSETKYSISEIYRTVNPENVELLKSKEKEPKEMKKIIRTSQSLLPVIPYYAVDYSANEIVLIVGGETEGLSFETLQLLWERRAVRVNVPLTNDVESLNIGVALGIITFEIQRQIVFKQRE